MKYVVFTNTYIQTKNDFLEEDAFASVTVDGYPEAEDAEGASIVEIFITKHRDIVVAWYENAYRMNESVIKLIEDSKKILYDMYDEEYVVRDDIGCVVFYVEVEFEDGTQALNKIKCDFKPLLTEAFLLDILHQIQAVHTLDFGRNVVKVSLAPDVDSNLLSKDAEELTIEIPMPQGGNCQ